MEFSTKGITMRHIKTSMRWLQAGMLVTAAILAACGGGGVNAPAAASVNGVAATGAAIAAGTVTLKCVSGTSTAAVTGTDGSFTVDIGSVTLPCVGRVDYKDSNGVAQKLHTFIGAAGTANITPVTDLLVANLTAGTPADAFDKFDAAKAKTYTTALVKAAAAAVKTYLKNTLGVDTANLPDDPVGTKLTAKSGGVAGDAFDKVLDDIQAKLKAGGKKLSDIAADVAKSGGGTSGGGSAAAPGSVVVTNSAVPSRNGTFAPDTALGSPTGSDSNITGNTKDGKFELNIRLASNGSLKGAAFWYFESGNVITFFSCNTTTIPCPSTISYEPLGKKILLSKADLSETTGIFDPNNPETLVKGGGKITLDGSLNADAFVLGK